MSINVLIRKLIDKTFGLNEIKGKLRDIENRIEGNVTNSQGHWKIRTFRDFKILLDGRSMVDSTMLKQGDWEQDSWTALVEIINHFPSKEMTFLDVGSYFGLYSLKAYRTHRFSRIVAFEADKVNASQLRSNLLLNDLISEIELNEIYLSDEAGQKSFASSLNWRSNRGMSGTQDENVQIREIKETKTLDQVITAKNLFVVLKLDVEGNELPVLQGAKKLFMDNRVLILIENIHHTAEQRELLTSLGFHLILEIPKDSNSIWKNFD